MFTGRAGVVLGVLAHLGGCGGGCAHLLSAPAHLAGAGLRAAAAARRVAVPVGRAVTKGAAAAADSALRVAAAVETDDEGAGAGADSPEPPDYLLCHTTAACGPGRTCDLVTGSGEVPPPWFPRSDEPLGICRPACVAVTDCFASERCVRGVDPGDVTVSACVPH